MIDTSLIYQVSLGNYPTQMEITFWMHEQQVIIGFLTWVHKYHRYSILW